MKRTEYGTDGNAYEMSITNGDEFKEEKKLAYMPSNNYFENEYLGIAIDKVVKQEVNKVLKKIREEIEAEPFISKLAVLDILDEYMGAEE